MRISCQDLHKRQEYTEVNINIFIYFSQFE